MPSLILPDGSRQPLSAGVSIAEALRAAAPRAEAVAAKVNGELRDLAAVPPADALIEPVRKDSADGLEILRHSVSHIMAEAVMRLFPRVKLAIGPAIENGFYYDFDLDHKLAPEDLGRIEAEMERIVKEGARFERMDLPRAEALRRLEAEGQSYKVELVEGLQDETISFYRSGNFADLCRGPHLPTTAQAGAFKLLSVAGAYWRGDEKNAMLQRIYGAAFPDRKALDDYLKWLEEAKARDHRHLGKQHGLFHLNDLVGPGLVLWMPKGAIIRSELESWIRAELRNLGYQSVYTPHIGRLGLYRTSGHYPYYRESQYPPLIDRDCMAKLAEENCGCAALSNRLEAGEVEGYLLKPMNCPHHIQIYKAAQRSYRDLPIRLAEFGTVYRYEGSGELNGMVRVRGFTQDDAHLFCTPEQLEGEIEACVGLVKMMLQTLGLTDVQVRVSLRDPASDKYVGSAENWARAEQNLRNVVRKLGMEYVEAPGEAAFYGPKIDFIVRDCLNRQWQLGTVQVDYNLPERFELEYIGADNAPHRPIMVHRAPLGSLERFVGILIEHFGAAFPLWLSPEQVRVMPIGEAQAEYAGKVAALLKEAGLRAHVQVSNEKIGAKIRQATLDKVPYMVIVGGKEIEKGVVSVRHRKDGDQGVMTAQDLLARLRKEIAEKK
jgi:threonyl-tRNA synthetase